MSSFEQMRVTPGAATSARRWRSWIVTIGPGLAAILLVGATVVLFPHHQPAPQSPTHIVPATDARLIFTIRQGQSLEGYVGYDRAIDAAQRFSLPVREDGRRISYAQARDPRINRIHVEIVVHPGDRFDLNGPPAAWTFQPTAARAKAAASSAHAAR